MPRIWVVVLVVLVLTGCASTRPTIKIGLLAPVEGVHRGLGYDALYAVKLAVRERNAQGGAGGYGIELVALSDDGQAAQADRQVSALAADPGVVGVLGPWQSTTANAAGPALARAGLPAVIPAALPDEVLQSAPGVYRLYAGDDALAQTLASAVPVGTSFTFSGDGAGWPAALDRVQPNAGSSAAIVFTGDSEAIARALPSVLCEEGGMTCLAGPSAQEPVVAARAGTAVTGLTWVSSLPVPDCRRNLARFCADYTALAGQPPGPHAVLAYEAAQVMLDAIALAASNGVPQRQTVAAALPAVRRIGLLGPIEFDINRSWDEAPTFLYHGSPGSLDR